MKTIANNSEPKIILIDNTDDKKYWKVWESIIRLYVGCRRIIRTLHLGLAIFKPEMPIFPSSISSSPGISLSILERVMYLPLTIYIIFTWWAHISCFIAFVVTFGFASLDTIENLR